MKFYDREGELKELKEAEKISEKHKVLIVITGRRRVGKTEIIHRFFSESEGLYFFVNPKKTSSELLSEFSSILSSALTLPEYVKIDRWESFFKLVFDASKNRRITIAIDEFQRLLDVDPSVIFLLQNLWDMQTGNILLIASGSSVGMIRKIFMEQKAPLFKRAHNILTVPPFDFQTVRSILNDIGIRDIGEQVKIFSIYGGIPMYYALMDDYGIKNAASSIDRLLLRDMAPLGREVSDILIEEFGKEMPTYYSILTAISLGKTSAKEICDHAGIKETSIAPYIGNLSGILGVVAKEAPAAEKKPWKSKKGNYFINDNFFRFWFRYIYRNMSLYEIKNYSSIKEKIGADINVFFGTSFEQICREFLIRMNNSGKTPFSFERIGRQWGKFRGEEGRNAYEIDIVALNEKTKDIMFVECKWQEKKTDVPVLKELMEKAKYVIWNNESRKEHFSAISKSGFTKEAENFAKENGFLLFGLKDFEKIF